MLLEIDEKFVKKVLYFNFIILLIDLILEISGNELNLIRIPIGVFTLIIPGFILFSLSRNNRESTVSSSFLSIVGMTLAYNLVCGLILGYSGFFNEFSIILINLFFSSIMFYYLTISIIDIKVEFGIKQLEFQVVVLLLISLIIRWIYVVILYSISIPEWDDNYAHMGRILALLNSETILDANLPLASEVSERPGNYNPSYPPGLYVLYGIISLRFNVSVFLLYKLMFYFLTLIETLIYLEIGTKLKNRKFGAILALFSTSLIHSGFYHGVYWVVPDFLSMLFFLLVINELWSINTNKFILIFYSIASIFTHYVGVAILFFLFIKIILEDFEYLKNKDFGALIKENFDAVIILLITLSYYLILLFSEGSIINLILKGNDGLPIDIKHHLNLYLLQFQFYLILVFYFSINIISSSNRINILQPKFVALFWLIIESIVIYSYFGGPNSNLPLWLEFIILRIILIPAIFTYAKKPHAKLNNKILQTSVFFTIITLAPTFVFGFALYFMAVSSRLLMIMSLYIVYSYLEVHGSFILKSFQNGFSLIKNKEYTIISSKFMRKRKHVIFTTFIALFLILILLTGIIINYEKTVRKRHETVLTDSNDEMIIDMIKLVSGDIIYDTPRTYSFFLGREVFNHPIIQNLTEIPWVGNPKFYVIFNDYWNLNQIDVLINDYTLELEGENFGLYRA